jgi:hypothetical protein
MNTAKTCPACHKENSGDASICAFCGSPLVSLLPSRTTEPVPEVSIPVKHPDHVLQLTKLYANIVVFTVLGQEQPILVKGSTKMILGRYSPGEVNPSVDLTPYNANLLGVSRQHAVITRTDNTYLLHDQDSTNGTWLNEVKLVPHKAYPLRSGDLIRLGQLALYVYFDTPQPEQDSITEFKLQKPGEVNQKKPLKVQEFSQQVAPYLDDLEKIQTVCDEILRREPSTLSIMSLRFDSDAAHINIKLIGGQEAVRLVKKFFLLQDERQPIPAVTGQETSQSGEQDTSQPAATSNGEAAHLSSASETILKIVFDLINELAAQREESDKNTYAQKLQPILNTLMANPLKIVDGA